MRLLTSEDIWNVYSMQQALDDTAAAFVATSAEEVMIPLRTRLNIDDRRTMLMMPSYSAKVEAAAVKTIGLYPDNAQRNLATAPATVLLLDGQTGVPKAILDGDTVTRIRTGASSGVAFRELAVADARVGVVVGTGGQAFTQVLAMIAAVPTLQEIRIVNPVQDLADSFHAQLVQWAPFKNSGFTGTLQVMTDSDEAARDADVITLVTSATDPVLSAKNLKPGVVISCVGSYQPHMQECGSDIIARADRIICDQVEAAVEESGDLIIPLRDGVISEADLSDEIGQIITGEKPGRSDDSEIFVYETVGVGSQDLWAANAIVSAALDQGVGLDWQAS